MCAIWASSDVRGRFLEHFFLGLSCFGSGGAGLASPESSALTSAPELHVSSFRHAAWLNFVDFRSSGDFFAYRILLSTIVCDIAVLLVLIVAFSALFFFTRESKIVEGVKIEPADSFYDLWPPGKKKIALHCPINAARLHRDYQKKKTKSLPVRRKDHLLWLISICMVLELCERSLITLRTKT